MRTFIIVDDASKWELKLAGVEVVSARDYLTHEQFSEEKRARVFNLCKTYRYHSIGYYVSLLAVARGHRPMPNIITTQDLRTPNVTKILSEDVDALIKKSLRSLQSNNFTLSIYFGRNTASRHEQLSERLFNLFEAPLLRAEFEHEKDWQLKSIRAIGLNDVPEAHMGFLQKTIKNYLGRKHQRSRPRLRTRFDLAILVNPDDPEPPSNEQALKKFEKAANTLGIGVERITKSDVRHLPEFDALFIRETTAVNHHTYRIARSAQADGLIVIDDPDSIIKCTNKVYLAELLSKNKISCPKTFILHKRNIDVLNSQLNFPVVLKQPDSAFSKGVVKVNDADELKSVTAMLLKESELIVAQEYIPTSFDWRVGVFDRRAIYVCKYFMVKRHWQIIHRDNAGVSTEGNVESFGLSEVPGELLKIALRACNLIGNGLYGVDIKQIENRFYIIEVNDNPSIDAGFEDKIYKDALYREVMGVFLRRIEEYKQG